MQDYLNGLYKEARQYDLVAFWKDICRDFTVKELLLFPSVRANQLEKSSKSKSKSLLGPGGTTSSDDASGSERLKAMMSKVQDEMNRRDESGLFASGG